MQFLGFHHDKLQLYFVDMDWSKVIDLGIVSSRKIFEKKFELSTMILRSLKSLPELDAVENLV